MSEKTQKPTWRHLAFYVCCLFMVMTFYLISRAPPLFDDYAYRLHITGQPQWAEWAAPPADKHSLLIKPLSVFETARAKAEGLQPWYTSPTFRWTPFRPLEFVTFYLDALMAPFMPGFAHIHSALWYLGAILAVFLFSKSYLGATAPAWWIAALFAITPTHVLAAQWVANRSAAMTALVGLLCLRSIITAGKFTYKSLLLLVISLLISEYGLMVAAGCLGLIVLHGEVATKQRWQALFTVAVILGGWVSLFCLFDRFMYDSGYYLVSHLNSPVALAQFLFKSLLAALARFMTPTIEPPDSSMVHLLFLGAGALTMLGGALIAKSYRKEAILVVVTLIPSLGVYPDGRTQWLPGLFWLIVIVKFLLQQKEGFLYRFVFGALFMSTLTSLVVWWFGSQTMQDWAKFDEVVRQHIRQEAELKRHLWIIGSPLSQPDIGQAAVTLGLERNLGDHFFWLTMTPGNFQVKHIAADSIAVCMQAGFWPQYSIFRKSQVQVHDEFVVRAHHIVIDTISPQGVANCITVHTNPELLARSDLLYWNGERYQFSSLPAEGDQLSVDAQVKWF